MMSKAPSDQVRYLANLLVENPNDTRALAELALIAKRQHADTGYSLTFKYGPAKKEDEVEEKKLHLICSREEVTDSTEVKDLVWTEKSIKRPSTYVSWCPLGPVKDMKLVKAFGAAVIECALFVEANNQPK